MLESEDFQAESSGNVITMSDFYHFWECSIPYGRLLNLPEYVRRFTPNLS